MLEIVIFRKFLTKFLSLLRGDVEVKKIIILEIDILRNSSQNLLGVVRGDF